ncbi:MAG: hypothetical protein KC910_13835 [Candidatus Eremiobacteraeota bacterium]|nr:hypothetical protein [Candidatus Eremiobacteraeota bacterium]
MSRMYQFFLAPGEEDEPLPLPDSPWHDRRGVRMPMEHWERFDELVAARLPEFLDEWDFFSNLDGEFAPRQRVEAYRAGLARLHQLVGEVDPLTPEVTPEIPENFPPAEHQAMLAAVMAVVDESLRLGEPFDSYVD